MTTATHQPPPLPAAPAPLGTPTTDAHTHLGSTARRSGVGVADALARAAAVGVRRVVDVGCTVEDSQEAVGHAESFDAVVAAVAIHPHDAVELGDGLDEALRAIEALLGTTDRIRGVGETGLDYHWVREEAGRARQRDAFAAHIAWAKQHDLALVIHDRDAHADLLAVLDAEGWPARVQMHCFSGDAEHARRCLDGGAFLSFPGTVTFAANDALREAARVTPPDRILVETDAPYLTPVPERGRPNASYLIPHTVRFLAGVRGEDADVLAGLMDANATALFGDWGTPLDTPGGGRG